MAEQEQRRTIEKRGGYKGSGTSVPPPEKVPSAAVKRPRPSNDELPTTKEPAGDRAVTRSQ